MQMHLPPENTGTYGELETAVMAEIRQTRRKTVEVCIRCIESLREDNQGLTLDAGTIDACTAILRNMMALSEASTDTLLL